MTSPSPPYGDGRDGRGRFTKGNPGGPGNPHAARVARLRSAMLEAVTDDDIAAVIAKLVELAKDGSVQAAREVLERVLGKAEALDVLARVEALEDALETAQATREKRWT